MLPPASTRPPTNLLPPTPFNLVHASAGSYRRSRMRILLMASCGSLNGTFKKPYTCASFFDQRTLAYLHMLCPSFQWKHKPSCALIWFCRWDGLILQICSVRHQNVANGYLFYSTSDFEIYSTTAGTYSLDPSSTASTARIQYIDVYMDDFNCTTQGDVEK